MQICDVTLTISNDLPVWPGDPAIRFERVSDVNAGDEVTLSRLATGSHIGTHVDAPVHFIRGGRGVDVLELDVLIGPCYLAHAPDAEVIDAALLTRLDIPPATTRLLIRTRNSEWWARGDTRFHPDFVAIDRSGAEWIVERGLKLIGVDYMSVAPFEATTPTHDSLLRANVIVIENLDLHAADPGLWRLICLPLKLKDGDGAPARVVLLRDE